VNKNKLPDFICLGAQKAGTTSLHNILRQHSQIFLPENKEANFFDKNDEYEKGVDNWCEAHFSNALDDQKIGVLTPDYLYYPYVAERISHTYLNSNLKFIVILRHPVDRAYSHYLMSKRRGYEDLSFKEAVLLENERINTNDYYKKSHFSYISRGLYLNQLERYLEYFDRNSFLFLSFESDIRSNLDSTVYRIEEFLGIGHELLSSNVHSNAASEVRSKSIQRLTRGDSILKKIIKKVLGNSARAKIKKYLINLNESKRNKSESLDPDLRSQLMTTYFSQEIPALEKLTGLDLSNWKTERD